MSKSINDFDQMSLSIFFFVLLEEIILKKLAKLNSFINFSLAVLFLQHPVDLFLDRVFCLFNLQFFALDPVIGSQQFVTLVTSATVSTIIILVTLIYIIDTTALPKMSAQGTHGTPVEFLIIVEATIAQLHTQDQQSHAQNLRIERFHNVDG